MRTFLAILLIALSSCAPAPAFAQTPPSISHYGWTNRQLIIEGHVRPGPAGRQIT